MPRYEITYPNGLTEVFHENLTPEEEARWFKERIGVSSFPSADYRASLQSSKAKELRTPPQEE